MALADTARLIASLELQDKFSANANKFDRTVVGLDKKMSALGASGQKLGAGLGRAFSTIAKIGAGVAVAGVGLLAVNVKKGVDALHELESVTVATGTVIKSTQGIAGQTAESVRALAEEYETLNATMDDKVIQSGANLLLTFTNIRKKAFEPALEAALNMNEAMGGGPEGLQNTIIQVGKALNDPIKGIGALRRVGVQLSEAQEEQIKKLVEQNDLYGAQQVILGELSTQFGGRFAAAGKTAERRMAALGDRVEDLQKALAGPLIPVIDRVREKLIDFLGSRQALKAAETLGDAIANLFTNENINRGVAFFEDSLTTITGLLKGGGDGAGGLTKVASGIGTIATAVGGLPWESIANAARLLGTGSKALLDAFLGLPPWVQTAVLTGWGLNKLTGGALGGIVGELSKGLIKGILNMNAGVVHINAKTVTGGGGGVATGGGGGVATGGGGRGAIGSVLGFAAKLIPVIAGLEAGANLAGGTGPVEAFLTPDKVNRVHDPETQEGIKGLNAKIEALDTNVNTSVIASGRGVASAVDTDRRALIAARYDLARNIVRGTDATTKVKSSLDLERAAANAYRSADASRIQGLRDSHSAANAHLAAIERKPTSFRATVNVTNNVGVEFSATAAAVQIRRVTQSTGNSQDFEQLN